MAKGKGNNPQQPPQKLLLSKREATKLAQVDFHTFNRWIETGVIPTIRVSNSRVKIPRVALEQFLKMGKFDIREDIGEDEEPSTFEEKPRTPERERSSQDGAYLVYFETMPKNQQEAQEAIARFIRLVNSKR